MILLLVHQLNASRSSSFISLVTNGSGRGYEIPFNHWGRCFFVSPRLSELWQEGWHSIKLKFEGSTIMEHWTIVNWNLLKNHISPIFWWVIFLPGVVNPTLKVERLQSMWKSKYLSLYVLVYMCLKMFRMSTFILNMCVFLCSNSSLTVQVTLVSQPSHCFT